MLHIYSILNCSVNIRGTHSVRLANNNAIVKVEFLFVKLHLRLVKYIVPLSISILQRCQWHCKMLINLHECQFILLLCQFIILKMIKLICKNVKLEGSVKVFCKLSIKYVTLLKRIYKNRYFRSSQYKANIIVRI